MSITAEVVSMSGGKHRRLADYEFAVCPRLGEMVQVAGPAGDLDFMKVVRVEHIAVELPRDRVNEGKVASVVLFVDFEERYSGGT